ncbi:peptidase C14 caspase catalytic subunit p20, partial [Candidatus Thiomargarita nelsonii]
MLKLITSVLLGLILTYSQSVFSATPRTALVIGNAAYQEGPLSAPVRDARALAEVLRKLDFQVIERTNLDLAQMKQAIGEFHQILSQRLGVGLFYYSGHGIQYQNQNYLIPIGTSQSLYATYPLPKKNLAVNEVLAAMNSAGNPVNLVFLDSCRTSPEVVKSWAKGQA